MVFIWLMTRTSATLITVLSSRDRVALFFTDLINHLARVIQTSQKYRYVDESCTDDVFLKYLPLSFFLERCVVGVLRLVIRMLSREAMVSQVMPL